MCREDALHQTGEQAINCVPKNNPTTSSSSSSSQTKSLCSPTKQQQHQRLGRLIGCTSGICICYLYYGYLQERLLTRDDASNHPQHLGPSFVLLTQCFTNGLVAYVWQQSSSYYHHAGSAKTSLLQSTPSHRNQKSTKFALPHRLLFWTSGCYVVAMVCSNEAIRYVSYPVAVLVKSCKLIPIMLVGQIMERKLYSTMEWMAVCAISIGIVLFQVSRMQLLLETNSTTTVDISLIEQQQSENWSIRQEQIFGLFLLFASLTMDGMLSSFQNLCKKSIRAPDAIETMLYINLYAILYLLPLNIWTGQWQEGIATVFTPTSGGVPTNHINDSNAQLLMQQQQYYYLTRLLMLNATVAAGQVFIFLTIAWFSPITTTLITTTRKFMTILLSVWTYGHSFTLLQWCAVLLVFGGLYSSIWTAVQPKHEGTATTTDTQRNVISKIKTN